MPIGGPLWSPALLFPLKGCRPIDFLCLYSPHNEMQGEHHLLL